ncbi:hypothetical protein DEO72_LG1g2328 [Vigna unguiculata]|uniref:Uncharacterized protein n=1 Tax=Vigna unguiculata TaxID=3917 RepID=A0A4D6KME1_VIGUN|nr:hypothetical protein DEO72_LG1g2328 [Vigna unguiculata]
MSSSSDRVSLSGSSSERLGGSGTSRSGSSDREEPENVERIPMERIVEVREDPPEELAESSWLAKAGYEWAAADVQTQHSIFRWSRLLKSWLNCTPIFEKGARRDIVLLERVIVVECVCHNRDGAVEEFFYMYMCHFSQLHIRLPFDEFTMGVLHLLNVALTQLHPNNGFFKVVVKQVGRSHFYTNDGNTKFPFFWTGNPWRYKGMAREELSVADQEVVDAVMLFSNKIPTKGLVRTLRKEKATRAKAARNTEVPNLQESLVDVHVHGGTKRKAELSARPGRRKDVKKVWAALLGTRSSSGTTGPEAGLIKLLETVVRRDIEINVPETLINSIDNMDPNHLVRTMVEFCSKALLLGPRVGSLYQRELKEGNQEKLEELQEKVDKHAEEKEAWKKEKEEWLEERKRLTTWRVRCLDLEEKLKGRIADLEANYDEMKEKHDGLEVELDDLKSYVIQEHINGLQKGLRQAAFFYKDVDAGDVRFDVNKDVVDGVLVDETRLERPPLQHPKATADNAQITTIKTAIIGPSP